MFIVILTLCFCACDNSKEQTTQCNNKLECDKKQCNKGDGGSVYGSAETFKYGDLTATMEWLEKACANNNEKG